VDKDGYPIFQAEPTLTRRGTRWLWEHLHGSIPAGQVICHRCDRPSCVRPDHLFLGSVTENNHDRDRKLRQSRHEEHPFARLTADQVAEIRAMAGRETHREIAARYGVSRQAVSALLGGRTWKPDDPAERLVA